jgi:hypothetical protein
MSVSLFDYLGKRVMSMPGRDNLMIIYWGKTPVFTVTRIRQHRYQSPDGKIETTLSEAVYNFMRRSPAQVPARTYRKPAPEPEWEGEREG